MTADELSSNLNSIYGLKEWPRTFTVDHETYANCCQFVFNRITPVIGGLPWHSVALGPHRGLMFKDIELLLP